jgi:hypothetical protein
MNTADLDVLPRFVAVPASELELLAKLLQRFLVLVEDQDCPGAAAVAANMVDQVGDHLLAAILVPEAN